MYNQYKNNQTMGLKLIITLFTFITTLVFLLIIILAFYLLLILIVAIGSVLIYLIK